MKRMQYTINVYKSGNQFIAHFDGSDGAKDGHGWNEKEAIGDLILKHEGFSVRGVAHEVAA